MARIVSAQLVEAMMAERTDEVVLFLLTLSHSGLDALVAAGSIDASPVRIVNNGEGVLSDDNPFLPFAFDCMFPKESEKGIEGVTIMIDNASQWLTPAVRSLDPREEFTAILQIATRTGTQSGGAYDQWPIFNNIEATTLDLYLVDTTMDERIVQGRLSYDDHLNAAFPAHKQTPILFPAL